MRKFGVKIVRGLVKVFGKLPLRVHYWFAGFLTWIMRDLMRYRYDVVMINLARSFPEKKYKELVAIAKECYRHLGEIFVEAIWFGASSYKRLYKSGIVTVTNPEVFNEMFEMFRKADNKPNIIYIYTKGINIALLKQIISLFNQLGIKIIPVLYVNGYYCDTEISYTEK